MRQNFSFLFGLFLFCFLNPVLVFANTFFLDDSEYYRWIVPKVKFSDQYNFDGKEKSQGVLNKSPIKIGLLSSFDIPWDDLYEREFEEEWKNLFTGFSGGFSLGYPLAVSKVLSNNGGSTQGGFEANNITASASLKYKLLGNWFVSTAAFAYKNEELQAPWNPDFVYSFGYSDWRPYTLSFMYANYGGNRWNPDRNNGERVTAFKQGAWTLGWKFPVNENISRWITFDDNGRIGCSIGYSVVPEYFDAVSSSLKRWKRSAAFGCKYSIWGNWYVNANLFYYPNSRQKQPWNPDFTYGFGYFDWRPGSITVQYNNYSGNRFGWHEKSQNTGKFKNGGISISWSWVY